MDVSIVIVTYNSASSIGECLRSAQAQEGIQSEIVVVDNASSDQTANAVRSAAGNNTLIENRENTGFARACNQGATASRGRFVYFLNPDAEIIGANGLAQLCRAMVEYF